MKALFYIAESQRDEVNAKKTEIMSLWADVHEVNVVGVVHELNEEQVLGELGKEAISSVLSKYKVDAVVVMSANELASKKSKICECIQMLHIMGTDVIAIQGDLPDCRECASEPMERANHCTVTIFE